MLPLIYNISDVGITIEKMELSGLIVVVLISFLNSGK
jgi:hypothetical protein